MKNEQKKKKKTVKIKLCAKHSIINIQGITHFLVICRLINTHYAEVKLSFTVNTMAEMEIR